jgi:hypothetical protein
MISHERLTELLNYDPETGVFVWNKNHGHAVAGRVAGGLTENGYWRIRVDRKKYMGHRLAWFLMTHKWPTEQIDHKDTDRANNRWKNLREATQGQNAGNAKLSKANRCGFKGVSFVRHMGKWRGQIMVEGKKKYLGVFATEEGAHAAYVAAANDAFGEFARAR